MTENRVNRHVWYTTRDVERLLQLHVADQVTVDLTGRVSFRLRRREEQFSPYVPNEVADDVAERADLIAALRRIDPVHRGILLLWFNPSMTQEQIITWVASQEGCHRFSQKTLIRRKRRALEALRDELNGLA